MGKIFSKPLAKYCLPVLMVCFIPLMAHAVKVQEIEVDGIRYELNFNNTDNPNGGYVGATATVIKSQEIYPKIPKFVEYEGIKYRVIGIDDRYAFDYPYSPILGVTITRGMDTNDLNACNLQEIYFDCGACAPYFPRLPNSLKEFHSAPDWESVDMMFNQYVKLTKVTFPILTNSLGYEFDYYHPESYDPVLREDELSEIVLGPLVEYILGCFNIDKTVYCSVTCPAPEPPIIDDSFEGWYGDDNKIKGSLHVPVGHADKYLQADVWKDFEYIYDDVDFAGNQVVDYIEDNGLYYGSYVDGAVKVIGPADRSIEYVSIASQVYFPYSGYRDVTEIADCAFINCENLINVNYPDQLYKVGDFAFYNSGTETARINIAPAEIIGNYSYAGRNVNPIFPDNVKSVGYKAFYYGINVSIEYYVGFGYDFTESLVLNEGLTTIGDYAFEGYQGPIVIPSTVIDLGEDAFKSYGTVRTDIGFPNSQLKTFPYVAFPGLSTNKLEIPESVEYIDAHVSGYAENVIIGKNVKSIQPFAFNSMQKSITCLSETVPQAWKESFGWENELSCANNMVLHVRKGLKWRYASAEGWNQFGEIIDDIDTEECEYQNLIFQIDRTNSVASVVGQVDKNYEGDINIPEYVKYEGTEYPVKKISKWAININGLLTGDIILPSTLEEIEDFALTHDENTVIDKLICNAETPPSINSRLAFDWPLLWYPDRGTLYVPIQSVEEYKNSAWNRFFNIEAQGFNGIDDIIESDHDTPSEYYDLHGRPVQNPGRGLFIMKSEGKVNKIMR